MYSHPKKKKDNTADLSFTSRTSNVQHFFHLCEFVIDIIFVWWFDMQAGEK